MDDTHRESYGSYCVEGVMGTGGAGRVLRARHRETGAVVALKVPSGSEFSLREQLRREIGILRRLKALELPGLAELTDSGIDRGTPWYAMQLVEGVALDTFCRNIWGREPAPDAVPVARTVTLELRDLDEPPRSFEGAEPEVPSAGALAAPNPEALGAALAIAAKLGSTLAGVHAAGIVHGDLAAPNVIISRDHQPVLLDFGTSIASFEADVFQESHLTPQLPRATPGYAAPEIAGGGVGDSRSDLYSFGCIVYELLTGRRPFLGPTPASVLLQHLHAPPRRPSSLNPIVPRVLDELVLSLLEKDPRARLSRAEDALDVFATLGVTTPPVPEGRAWSLFRSECVGREASLAALEDAAAQLSDGVGSSTCLTGSAGIGKTRLLQELGMSLLRRGLPVVACRASQSLTFQEEASPSPSPESSGFSLLRPVIERALLDFRALPGERRTPVLREHLARVVRFSPHHADAELDLKFEGSLDRLRTFESMYAVFELLAETRGLALLLDDVQRADELSLDFLQEYAARLETAKVAVFLAYRADQVPASIELLASRSRRVELEPLGAAEVERLAKSWLGASALPEGLDEFLVQRSGGNPFFASEYLRQAMLQGWLRRGPRGAWTFPTRIDLDAAAIHVPASLEGFLRARTSRLSDSARQTLEVASLLGATFSSESLPVAEEDQLATQSALEELASEGLLSCISPGHYQFRSSELRDAQRRILKPEVRALLHRRIAEHLEPRAHTPAELGVHWALAGESRRALPLLTLAAAEARDTLSLSRAADLYRFAIRHFEGGDQGDGQQLLELNEALADVLLAQAKHAEARQRLISLSEQLPPEPALRRARIQRKLAASYWTVHEYEAAGRALDRAEHELSRLGAGNASEFLREQIQIRLGRFEQVYFSQRTGLALDRILDDIAPLIERHGSAEQQVSYYLAAASHRLMSRRFAFQEEALSLARKGADAARDLPLPKSGFGSFMVGFTLAMGGSERCREAVAQLLRADECAARTGDVTLLARARAFRTKALRKLGDVEGTLTLSEPTIVAAERARMPPYVALAKACRGWALFRLGNAREAQPLLRDAIDLWRKHPHPFPFHWTANLPLLAYAQASDDFDAARSILDGLLDPAQQALPRELEESLELARVTCRQEAPRAIAECLTQSLSLARQYELL